MVADRFRFRGLRRMASSACAVLLSAAMTAGLAACGGAPATFSQPDGPTIAIGVAADEPGLALWHDGAYAGFEVEIARYVAKKLGYANKQIVFKQVLPFNRLSLLDKGVVDMVVAGTPMPRKTTGGNASDGDAADADVTYAGPYLSVAQGLLVRPDDADAIDGTDALAGRHVCVVAGSGAKEALLAVSPKAETRERDTYPQCITDLMIGTADAIAGDDAVLAGLARAQGGDVALPVRGVSYDGVRYAIALPAGAETLAENVEAALKDMRADGSYRAALRGLEADTGWRPSRS